MSIFLIILVLFMVACIWGLYINIQTFKERSVILKAVSDDSKERINDGRYDYLQNYDYMNQTTYTDHFWALFFFRDPMKLYHQDIQDVM